ncbi:hypothetical protein NMY3_03029 [Candidatus Nitrosocosmicus oleophilus]|uniref:Uncharacterized protein n=1 Tax=Candidatus Nitrosocosmicus oleophilus TaxID=1353260 RepID=A0A654M3K5_9ARCH|nr:hypothetical protein [Candidatus Nitrosocosmicus oleophilus]ALI37216.1 hypothetical protein NMY3_03029 [Candidatus Nitrosocosmicus oleophilus]
MDFSFFNHPVISFSSNNDEWWQILILFIPLIISGITLAYTVNTFYKTIPRMKKSEQIKMVHDIQTMYLSAFDKYVKSIKDNDEHRYIVICYTSLLNALEWYMFLKDTGQLEDVFDNHFETYFIATCKVFEDYKDDIKDRNYIRVRKKWEKMKSQDPHIMD